jgi:CspA family cold shock protein
MSSKDEDTAAVQQQEGQGQEEQQHESENTASAASETGAAAQAEEAAAAAQEEPVSHPPRLEGTALKGTVKWFKVDKAYGFISVPDGLCDIFVHQKDIDGEPGEALRVLEEGQEVAFVYTIGKSGKPTAKNVLNADGTRINAPTRAVVVSADDIQQRCVLRVQSVCGV